MGLCVSKPSLTLFGADFINRYNGFGGKVEPGESSVEAAVRELKVSNRSVSSAFMTDETRRKKLELTPNSHFAERCYSTRKDTHMHIK
jgi:hypothetical protein